MTHPFSDSREHLDSRIGKRSERGSETALRALLAQEAARRKKKAETLASSGLPVFLLLARSYIYVITIGRANI
jgi:hypothetical protein